MSVKDRLFQAGSELFAEQGFDSVSVREICKQAQTSVNMVHHYFGSKDGLFDAIVGAFTERVFAFPIRLLEKEVRSKEEFISRLELFFEETLNALIENRMLLHVIARHEIESPAMAKLMETIIDFLTLAQKKGFVQKDIEPELMSGFLFDRLANQVVYAKRISKNSAHNLIEDADYRARWTRSNLNLFLYGMVSKSPD